MRMPPLGDSVTEGTVTRWLKHVGDFVSVDEPLVEVSTDKIDTEIPSPWTGLLDKILIDEDQTVEVGDDLAIIIEAPSKDPGPRLMTPPSKASPQKDGHLSESYMITFGAVAIVFVAVVLIIYLSISIRR